MKMYILQDQKVKDALGKELEEDLHEYDKRNDTRARFEKIHKEVRLHSDRIEISFTLRVLAAL